jgi:putative NADH-flavin reductase
MNGQDVLVNSVSGFDEPADFFPRVARSLVQAARSVGAKAPRILWVGGASSLPTEPGGRPASETNPDAKPFQKGKQEALAYLRTVQDVSWTELTPPSDIEAGVRTGKFRLGDEVLLKDVAGKSAISMEDYAAALLDEIEQLRHVRQIHRRLLSECIFAASRG